MRVGIGKQECEERKLCYLVARRIGRHHATGAPEIELTGRKPLDHCPPRGLTELNRAVQVPENGNE